MKILGIAFNLFFQIIDYILTFAMLHSKISVLLFIFWLVIVWLIGKKAEKAKIFGFWWKINRGLDVILNEGLIICGIIFVIELIGCLMMYLSLYKGM
ncbi:hypothetical protein PT287_09700 [Lactobacillus sp. ESL0679]|nr:hypothetical protein [Lactobacillus sp. ESL0679]